MLKTHVKTAFRSLVKNKFYTFLNVFGLAVGLATCLLISLYVVDEMSYDEFNAKADRIFRVDNEVRVGENYGNSAQGPALMGPEIVREFPQVEQYTRLRPFGSLIVQKGVESVKEQLATYADSTLFDVFTLPLLSGDPSTALKEPYSMVITETIARKYFNSINVVGRSLFINNKKNYKVTGVLKDLSEQSHFRYDFFIAFSESDKSRSDDWLSQNFNTYILLREGANPQKIEPQLNKMMTRHLEGQLKSEMHISLAEFEKSGSYARANLTPLTDIHLLSHLVGELSVNGDMQFIYIFSSIAFVILVIACVNFINLTTARSASRAREVGVRKILGSKRESLIGQFLVESMIVSLLALVFCLLFAWQFLPVFNDMAGKHIDSDVLFSPTVLTSLVLVILVVGLAVGIYPAFFLSSFAPMKVLKGAVNQGFKGTLLRNSLVAFQFTISIILIAGTTVIYNQMSFIRSRDVGFSRNQILVIENTKVLESKISVFKNELLQVSGVKGATITSFLPVSSNRNSNTFFPTSGMDQKSSISMQDWSVDDHYIPTMGMQVINGRNFSSEFSTDSSGVIINEAAAKYLGVGNPVNKKLYQLEDRETGKVAEYHILGVVKNFNYNSLRELITPLGLFFKKDAGSISLSINTANAANIIQQINSKWKAFAPDQPFEYSFLDERFDHMYADEQRTGRIFITFASIAIVIGCLGLFGLVTYATEQRRQEIGIRKVLGADVAIIAGMISKDFLKLVLVASLVAFPIAWWGMNKWLQDFAYRVDISWKVFLETELITLSIALATISFHTIKAALTNPVKSLRSE